MSSANLDLARSIFAAWEQNDWDCEKAFADVGLRPPAVEA
jgi:hypothetical protein